MHELTVPADYVEDFRAAIVLEIAYEAEQVEEHRKQAAERERHDHPGAESEREDMLGAMDLLAKDAALLALPALNGDGDRKIQIGGQVEPETVAHVLETMARKIVGPALEEQLEYGPQDGHAAVQVRGVVARLSWAIDHAAELHDLAHDQRTAGVA